MPRSIQTSLLLPQDQEKTHLGPFRPGPLLAAFSPPQRRGGLARAVNRGAGGGVQVALSVPPGAISERAPASSEAGEEYQLHCYWAPSGARKRKLKGKYTPGINGPLLAANHPNWSLGCALPSLVKDMAFLLFRSISAFSEMFEGG